jgi:hypothetical protein
MGFIQKEWLVYFYEADEYPYPEWLQFLKKGFKHCGALNFDPEKNVWIHLEYTHAGIKHSLLSKEQLENMLFYLKDYEVLRCPEKEQWQLFRIKDMTCVSFIMRLIGFYKWYILTPYQLYCALIKAGYKSFNEKIKDPNVKN